MPRSFVFSFIFICLILSVSSVSAFTFSDFFGKISGRVISDSNSVATLISPTSLTVNSGTEFNLVFNATKTTSYLVVSTVCPPETSLLYDDQNICGKSINLPMDLDKYRFLATNNYSSSKTISIYAYLFDSNVKFISAANNLSVITVNSVGHQVPNSDSKTTIMCTDSDGGFNYNVTGKTKGILYKGAVSPEYYSNMENANTFVDSCISKWELVPSYGVGGTSYYKGEMSAACGYKGANSCGVIDYACYSADANSPSATAYDEVVDCLGGCLNGACLPVHSCPNYIMSIPSCYGSTIITGEVDSNGCNLPSRCASEDEITCKDSDFGLNYTVKGTVNLGDNVENVGYLTDSCSIMTEDRNYYSTAECSGNNCFLEEAQCAISPTNNEQMITSTFSKCENGCSDGTCINQSNNGLECATRIYSDWGPCIDGLRYRTLINAGPESCNQLLVGSQDVGKCSISDGLNESLVIIDDGKVTLVSCDSGCLLDNKCLPIGTRTKSKQFCSSEGNLVPELKSGLSCSNNFECSSNVCVNDQCIDSGLIDKMLNWFKKLFTSDSKPISEAYPASIGEFSLVGETNEGTECQAELTNSQTGKACWSTTRLNYQTSTVGAARGVFVLLTNIESGKEAYDISLKESTTSETLIVGDDMAFRVRRAEDHELLWKTGQDSPAVVTTQEYISSVKSTGIDYEYGHATGDNAVTTYFIEKYVPFNN